MPLRDSGRERVAKGHGSFISTLLLYFPLSSDSNMKYTYEVPAAFFPPSAAWYLLGL